MTDCTEREIREMLPDVVHGTVVPGDRARVDAHLATCALCRTELKVLREVHGAAVFAPSIDVDCIVRNIPPYAVILPDTARPTRSKVVSWLVAASLVVLVAGGSSVLMQAPQVADSPAPVVTTVQAPAPGLALASGVDDLTDGGLAQLISEVDGFDAMPATEVDPPIDVDATASIDQDSL